MKGLKRVCAALLSTGIVLTGAFGLLGCGSLNNGKRIVRISHAQSETHPEHLGLLKFKEYIEERLGDKYICTNFRKIDKVAVWGFYVFQ